VPAASHIVDGARPAPADGDADGAPFPSAKAEEAYRALQAWIHEGRYAPGERLKEVEIAEQLGVSRTPVRQAFVQLQRDGAVAIVPNRGAIVRQLTAEELDDIYGLRAVLEGFCASRAATRMDAMAISELRDIHAEFERYAIDPETPPDVLIRLNAMFHDAIVAGSGSARAATVLDTVANVAMPLKLAFWSEPRVREIAIVYHYEIVEAIRTADPVRAEAVMRSHVYAVKDDMVAQHRVDGIRSRIGAVTA
jgi:DNA-binding GntR family transcriptional regulator